jgi:hypothetical protein
MDDDLHLTVEVEASIAALAKRYLWWDGPSVPHTPRRAVAQIMNLGTYDDILRLEALVPRATLVDVLSAAQPGWFSPRSWEFWRGRLRADVSDHPPVRSFADAG